MCQLDFSLEIPTPKVPARKCACSESWLQNHISWPWLAESSSGGQEFGEGLRSDIATRIGGLSTSISHIHELPAATEQEASSEKRSCALKAECRGFKAKGLCSFGAG